MPRALTTLLTLVLAGALAAPAAAAPKKNPKSAAETAAYWTAERMKNAKPRERAKPGGGGGPGKVSDWSRYAVPTVNGAYTGEHLKNGKVFMTIDGVDYVCSGTAVQASNNINLVWTAGHCVTDGPDHEATNLSFVPGYRNGAEPKGKWTYTVLDSTDTWERQGADRFDGDVGAFQVELGDTGATFDSQGIGTRTLAFGQRPEGRRLVSFGYPAAGKFTGATQYACESPFRRWDTQIGDPMQISCDMTGGSSGGGWILDTNGVASNTTGEPLVSVNSYGYQGEKNTMYGPYMGVGSEANALYNTMSTTTP